MTEQRIKCIIISKYIVLYGNDYRYSEYRFIEGCSNDTFKELEQYDYDTKRTSNAKLRYTYVRFPRRFAIINLSVARYLIRTLNVYVRSNTWISMFLDKIINNRYHNCNNTSLQCVRKGSREPTFLDKTIDDHSHNYSNVNTSNGYSWTESIARRSA